MKKVLLISLVSGALLVFVINLSAQSNDDLNACEFARKDSNVETWKFYLENFPNGECSAEAKAALQSDSDSKDQTACNEAREQNSFVGWEQYLKNFPNGKCNFEAKVNMKKAKKIGNLIWSDRSSNKMNWNSAKQYCENLSEGGFTDWRLPNIDELRTTIRNCSKTEPGGECKVSEKHGHLSINDWQPSGSCHCEIRKNNGGYYSKLGDDDNIWLWSSSTSSDHSDSAWPVGFVDGYVNGSYDKSSSFYVRCVRTAD
jgi:hypothetical protein